MSGNVLQDAHFKDIDLDAFNDMTLLAEDTQREVVFSHTQHACLHRAPVQSTGITCSRRGYQAWVMFSGREMGVFETW
jgi:hypothetical protein